MFVFGTAGTMVTFVGVLLQPLRSQLHEVLCNKIKVSANFAVNRTHYLVDIYLENNNNPNTS
jgi:hypothetical protein